MTFTDLSRFADAGWEVATSGEQSAALARNDDLVLSATVHDGDLIVVVARTDDRSTMFLDVTTSSFSQADAVTGVVIGDQPKLHMDNLAEFLRRLQDTGADVRAEIDGRRITLDG